ncbi:MAG: DUF1631 domain-containing protein [Burkholderiaceae bacterium]|jgi:hypothetical protein|nr:DUF1631 domain-containing protein [Burkholderiaceae bacterium]
MEFPPSPEASRTGGEVPHVTASQASALLRSGIAISTELIGAAFPEITKGLLEELSGKWDFDVGSPLVQRHLATKSDDLFHAFMGRLQETQDQYLSELTLGRTQGPAPALDAETLSLVDSISVESTTVVDRHASKIAGRADHPLRDLNLVVAFLLGRGTVRMSENPLGPSVYVRALLRAAEETELHKEAWEYFLTLFEKPLGEELARIVQQLLDHFAKHGVDARAIRRTMSAPKSSSAAFGTPGPAGLTSPAAWTGGSGVGTGGPAGGPGGVPTGTGAGQHGTAAGQAGPDESSMLLGGLLTRLQANARGSRLPSLPALGPAPQQLLESVGEFQHHDLQGMGVAGDYSLAPAAETVTALRNELISKSTRVVDKLTIELVGMLFDHVMQDKQVPAEIKARISRLQFPVLKAALMDAAFFASSAHPARKLIDRIAGTSAGWEPYGDDNQRYLKEVDRVITEILKTFETDITVFERLYGEFDKFVSDIRPEENDPVSRAKKALEAAEKHEILTINTTIQVRRAFERVDLEPYIKEFLLGAWVKVLVAATVRNETQPGFAKAFRDVIHELVWSVQPKASTEDRSKLVKLIPNMVRVLRDGLGLINVPERERDLFFTQLMESHAMAVKPVDQATYIKSSLLTSELRAKIDGMQLSGIFPVTTVPGGIRVSTGLIKRHAEEQKAEISMPDEMTDIARLDPVEDARVQEEIGRWQRGTWFKLWNGMDFNRVKLRWMSPLRTLFLFAGEHDQKAHVLSAENLKSYLARKYIEPLESVPLTKRAVDAVVADFEGAPERAKALAGRYAASQPA